MVGVLQVLADQAMVVDLAIDGQNDALIGIGEWLSSALCFLVSCRPGREVYGSGPTNADDTEPLMAQYCSAVLADSSTFTSPRTGARWAKKGFQSILVLLEMTLPPAIREKESVNHVDLGVHNRPPGVIRIQTHSNQVPDAGLCRDKRVN